MKPKHFLTLGILGSALALAPLAANANGPKGPRASVLSSTECALDLITAELVITTTLTNKSSGITIPETRDGSMIKATYKHIDDRGNMIRVFPEIFTIPGGVPVNPEETFEARFSLCDIDGDPRQEVQDARELNGQSTVNYGIEGGGGETRPVPNRCSDNPDTPVNEGGIKVDDATFGAIMAACSAQP